MGVIQRQTNVNASDSEVFGYLLDISRHSEWAGH